MAKELQKLTIHNIAKMANVSPGTVSRVLSGKSGVGEETRQRVQTLIDSLNYRPNISAQRLGSRRGWSIGLVFSRTTSAAIAQPIFPVMIGAISDFLEQENYTLTLFGQTHNPDKGVLQALTQGKVDGVILPDVRTNDELVNHLRQSGFPFVAIGQRYTNPEISWVDTNHDETVERLTELLIDKNHKRIAFINGSDDYSASLLRARGFQNAMGKRGLAIDPNFMRSDDYSSQTGYHHGSELLALPEGIRPSAIVAGSDLIAVGCLKAVVELGLRVPHDLAITAFDDSPIAQYTQPPLTTAHAPIGEMGVAAAKFILTLVNNEHGGGQHLILPSQIVIRESSG